VRAWQEVHGTLPCGVTFLVEGEEEIGSPSLGAFARAHQDLLQADGCLWEAGARNERGTITITAGLKGVLSVELRVQTVAYDLHSSNAPLAPSAAWRLVEALGSLHEPSGRVRIPGFYDAVRPPTESERSLLARFPIETPVLRQSWQIDQLLGPGDDPVVLTEHLLYAPTCNICGMWSGYQGLGGKTVLPATAGAKLDFRLVPDQEPGIILTLLERYLAEQGLAMWRYARSKRHHVRLRVRWRRRWSMHLSVRLASCTASNPTSYHAGPAQVRWRNSASVTGCPSSMGQGSGTMARGCMVLMSTSAWRTFCST
jgi:acetylornithine deacetylase/succinyl-diaminopimelate desuccinylase-like protein